MLIKKVIVFVAVMVAVVGSASYIGYLPISDVIIQPVPTLEQAPVE